MSRADGWFSCRIAFVETVRAVGLAGSRSAAKSAREEWTAFAVIEVDQRLAQHAAALTLTHELRSFDALHLAAALLPTEGLLLATWDRRLHAAVGAKGLGLLPATLD